MLLLGMGMKDVFAGVCDIVLFTVDVIEDWELFTIAGAWVLLTNKGVGVLLVAVIGVEVLFIWTAGVLFKGKELLLVVVAVGTGIDVFCVLLAEVLFTVALVVVLFVVIGWTGFEITETTGIEVAFTGLGLVTGIVVVIATELLFDNGTVVTLLLAGARVVVDCAKFYFCLKCCCRVLSWYNMRKNRWTCSICNSWNYCAICM